MKAKLGFPVRGNNISHDTQDHTRAGMQWFGSHLLFLLFVWERLKAKFLCCTRGWDGEGGMEAVQHTHEFHSVFFLPLVCFYWGDLSSLTSSHSVFSFTFLYFSPISLFSFCFLLCLMIMWWQEGFFCVVITHQLPAPRPINNNSLTGQDSFEIVKQTVRLKRSSEVWRLELLSNPYSQ